MRGSGIGRCAAVAFVYVAAVGHGAPAHATPAATKLVMSTVGTFDHTTRLFSIAGSEWQLRWSYNCRPMGEKENFIVDVRNRGGYLEAPAANELGWSGHATEYMHQGGTFYLDITSGCAWSIQIYGSGGSRLLPIGGSATVLRASGSGIHQTQLFHVPNEWQLRWSYDCRSFGGQGNFIVNLKDRSGQRYDLLVNELARSDAGTEYLHQGGTLYLQINSECSWHVRVTH